MAENIEYENLISIGFLNSPKNELDVKKYLEKYDIVITNDGSFEIPLEILKAVIGKK